MRTLSNGSILTTTVEEAPTATTAMDMNREFTLNSQANGDLKVSFCLPLIDVTSFNDLVGSTSTGLSYGAALSGIDALSGSISRPGSTLLLNPMVNQLIQYSTELSTYAVEGMVCPSSPQLGLQALAYSKYKMNRLGFAYQPQGQTFQQTPDTLAESRLRFCFTGDPTHPVLGLLGYRGTGTIDYTLLTETPNSVQFAEWNAWNLEVKDFHTDWLNINVPRFVPETIDVSPGNVAETRQECLGAVTVFDSNGLSTSRVIMPHGELWWHGEIVFSDPSPLLVTYVPPALRSALTAIGCRSDDPYGVDVVESKEEKKTSAPMRAETPALNRPFRVGPDGAVVLVEDDDDVHLVSPPGGPYRATPSRVPGGSLYSPRTRPPSKK